MMCCADATVAAAACMLWRFTALALDQLTELQCTVHLAPCVHPLHVPATGHLPLAYRQQQPYTTLYNPI